MAEFEAQPLPRAALLFMAAVEEARRTTEGPFRAIAPVFRMALEPQRGEILNIERASTILAPIMGGAFTYNVVEAFLPHLEKLGWLREERAGNNQVAYRVTIDLPDLDGQKAVESSEEKLNNIYRAFIEFLEATTPLLAFSLSEDQFKWQMFRWATSLDGVDKDAIQEVANRLVEGATASARNMFLDDPHRFSRIDKGLSVEFAAFVKWLAKYNRPEIVDISSLTELGLASEFLEQIRSPALEKDLKVDVTLVLDAPVILDILGLSGESRKVSIESCIASMKVHGAKVVTLMHCLEELTFILKAILEKPPSQRFGLTGDALRSDYNLVEFARQVARQPDKAVKNAGVEVLTFDHRTPLNAEFFSDELIDKFRNTASWHDQTKREQRERDALSIAFVMRRRRGNVASDVLESKFVLVARNATFTSFSEAFVRRTLNVPDFGFGPSIETKTLSALAWMRFGSSPSSDLPQLHLVSACDRILASNGELLRRAEKKLRLISDDETVNAMLGSQQAVFDLVVSVGGSPDVIDGANGEELLRAFTTSAEERGRSSERERAEVEKKQLLDRISTTEQDIADKERHATELAVELIRKQTELRHHEEEKEKEEVRRRGKALERVQKFNKRAEELAWWPVGGVWAVCALVGVIGSLLIWRGVEWWINGPLNILIGMVVLLCAIVAMAFSLRWLPPGRLDLAAVLHYRLTRSLVRRRIGSIDDFGERRLVLKAWKKLDDEVRHKGAELDRR